MDVDPDDFAGFWSRSRPWIGRELATAAERSAMLLGADGLLLSQLIQVSGERILGPGCGHIRNIGELLTRTEALHGSRAERDVRAYYTSLCELYNRSLADTLLLTSNSPRWQHHVAAMDLWREDLLTPTADTDDSHGEDFDLTIKLPKPKHLRGVSGDVLLDIRRTASCERYFESLASWRTHPDDGVLKGELVESFARYASDVMRHVGREVGAFGLRPRFLSKAADISGAIDKAPGLIQGFLAMGTGAAAVSAGVDAVPIALPASMFSLFCLQTAAKHYTPTSSVEVSLSARDGARIHADITVTRAG
jgi:hypothetical protein